MEINESAQALFTRCECDFVSMIEGTFYLVYFCYLLKEKTHKPFSYPQIIKGNLNEIGSKFIIKRYELNLKIFYEITDLVYTDYFALIRFHVYKTIPETFVHDLIVCICNSSEKECIIHTRFSYDRQIRIPDKEIQKEFKKRNTIFKMLSSLISQRELYKLVPIYVLINCNINLMWNILLNMKMVHKYVSLLADKIEYNNEIIEKDDIINLFFKKGNEFNHTYGKVSKCQISKKEAIIEILFVKKKINSSPTQTKITIRVYECEKKCTLYVFYFFNQALDDKTIVGINKKKEQELIKFKNMVEHFIFKNSSNICINENKDEKNNNNDNSKNLVSSNVKMNKNLQKEKSNNKNEKDEKDIK